MKHFLQNTQNRDIKIGLFFTILGGIFGYLLSIIFPTVNSIQNLFNNIIKQMDKDAIANAYISITAICIGVSLISLTCLFIFYIYRRNRVNLLKNYRIHLELNEYGFETSGLFNAMQPSKDGLKASYAQILETVQEQPVGKELRFLLIDGYDLISKHKEHDDKDYKCPVVTDMAIFHNFIYHIEMEKYQDVKILLLDPIYCIENNLTPFGCTDEIIDKIYRTLAFLHIANKANII